MAGTYRHGRIYCHARARRAVEIDLPMAWEADAEYTVLTVVVGLCQRHGHDVAGRVRGLLEARAELPQLLTIIDAAVVSEQELQGQLEAAEAELERLELPVHKVAAEGRAR